MPLNANDIIYGGLGNDSIHGGAGDDAISGAEALPRRVHEQLRDDKTDSAHEAERALIESDYSHPCNPGNVLGYSADADLPGAVRPERSVPRDHAERRTAR